MDFDINKVAVLGTGVTGTAVIEYLASIGVAPVPFEHADVMVVSPGIPPEQFPEGPRLVMSEIEFAYQLFKKEANPPQLIAVTGTNGKSTVTAMIAHILSIPIAGNFGVPLIQFVGKGHSAIVVEVSSYQLETTIEFCPQVSVVTNITPDHLERHKTMAAYVASKSHVCRFQAPSGSVVYLDHDSWVNQVVGDTAAKRYPISMASDLTRRIQAYSDTLSDGNGLGLIGAHNNLNAAMAVQATAVLGVGVDDALVRLSTFLPLPHRMEWVATIQDRDFFDDSKATNPDSTLVAIQAFSRPIHLLLGGKDKGLELEAFLTTVVGTVKTVTVYGEIAGRCMAVLNSIQFSIPVFKVETLDQATDAAFTASAPGDVILLSPACSSFDQFIDFNHRGDHFKEYVRTKIA